MLKPEAIRKQRSKCFKLRNTLQIFLLAAVAIWLLYELKCSHEKEVFHEGTGIISQRALGVGHEEVSLGRRGLQPWAKETDFEIEINGESEERKGSGDEEDREEIQEESEVLEELVDVEDKEREEEIEDHAVDD